MGTPPPREPSQLYITRAFEKWPPSRCASSAWWAATASRPTGFQKKRYVKLFGQWGSRLASAGLRSLARPPRPALASLALGSPALSSQRLRRVSACGLRPFIGVCPPPAPMAGPRPAGAAFGRALGPVRPPKGGSLPSAPVVFLRRRAGTPPPAGGALRAPPEPSRFRIIYGSLRIIYGSSSDDSSANIRKQNSPIRHAAQKNSNQAQSTADQGSKHAQCRYPQRYPRQTGTASPRPKSLGFATCPRSARASGPNLARLRSVTKRGHGGQGSGRFRYVFDIVLI